MPILQNDWNDPYEATAILKVSIPEQVMASK